MLKIFVEVHTSRHDGTIAITRNKVKSTKEAVLGILSIVSGGYYYTTSKDQNAAMVLLERPEYCPQPETWEYPNSPVYSNDFGELVTICYRRYGVNAQVKEGTFYI